MHTRFSLPQHRPRAYVLLAALAGAVLAGCAAPPLSAVVPRATPDFSAATTGSGAVRQQFVLKDPRTQQAAPHTPYHLAIRGMVLSANPKQSWDGVTDAQGRTVTVLSDQPIASSAVVLVRRFGEGNYGELFSVSDPANRPLANVPVTLSLCDGREFASVSDAQGYVGYVATATPCAVTLKMRFATVSVGDDE